MRIRRLAVLAILVTSSACGRGAGRAKPAEATGDAATVTSADGPMPAPASPVEDAARATFLASTPIAPGSPLPAGARKRLRVVGGAAFTDGAGANRVVMMEERSQRSTWLVVMHLVDDGHGERRVTEVKDLVEDCAGDATRYVAPEIDVTDLDGDGIAELGFGYHVGCPGEEIKLKLLLYEAGTKYIVRGTDATDGVPEPAVATWPAGWLAVVRDRYAAAASAAATSPGVIRSGDDFADVDLGRDEGDVTRSISYPRLVGIPAQAAADLTRRMREHLRADDPPDADRTGHYEADCKVELATPEAISIVCRRLDSTLTKSDQAAGTGGVAGDYTRIAITVWLSDPALAPIDPLELVGNLAPLVATCGPVTSDRLVLTPDGLTAINSDEDDAPRPDACASEPLAWDRLAPRTARAKALVKRLVVPDEP